MCSWDWKPPKNLKTLNTLLFNKMGMIETDIIGNSISTIIASIIII